MFSWYKQISTRERKTFWACFSGWALDALDSQLLGLAIPALMISLAMSKAEAGMVAGVTLVASALGGWVAGSLSDRYGRVKILQVTILWFSVFTFFSAFAQSYHQLLVLKALQGIGFGGEWAAGAVLMAETIRSEHRGKAMGSVQSAWAVGWGLAVIVYTALAYLLTHIYSFSEDYVWRGAFMIGLLPAFLVIYVRRSVQEPDAIAVSRHEPDVARRSMTTTLLGIFGKDVIRSTLIGGLLGIGAHGGYAALMSWLPTYLKTERHLSMLGTGGYLAVIIIAFGAGCLTAAQLLDKIGRRHTVAGFAVCCVITICLYLMLPLSNLEMLFLGFPLGFFAAGIPASMGALFNELYPSGVRGTGVGFCYNFGRVVSSGFPVLVGYMSAHTTLGTAIGVSAGIAYGIVVIAVLLLPETRGLAMGQVSINPLRPNGAPS